MERRSIPGHPDMMVVRGFTPLQEFYLQRMWYLVNLAWIYSKDPNVYLLIAKAMYSTYRDLQAMGVPEEVLQGVRTPKNLLDEEGAKRLAQTVRKTMEGGSE